MENKLKTMFEYQRFDPSSKLSRLIEETEMRYGKKALSDDDLSYVAAAGTGEQTKDLFDLAKFEAKPSTTKDL